MTTQVLENDYVHPFRVEQAAEAARIERLFRLAEHNGYSTRTYHSDIYGRCWIVPDQLITVTGFQVGILS